MSGTVTFRYADQPSHQYKLGQGEYAFVLEVSGSSTLIYVYSDPIKAIGLVTEPLTDDLELASFITPGRIVRPTVGQSVVLMNDTGNLCLVTIEEIQDEVNGAQYVPPHIVFSYRIAMEPER